MDISESLLEIALHALPYNYVVPFVVYIATKTRYGEPIWWHEPSVLPKLAVNNNTCVRRPKVSIGDFVVLADWRGSKELTP